MTETGSFEEIKITWEMFEGSLALTQVGIFWKEYSRKATDQISGTAGAAKTLEVMRLRRAWHLPYYSATGPYDDEEDGTTNQNRQELITVHNPTDKTDAHQWFAGDVVPFQHCAYLVNFNSQDESHLTLSNQKYYSF